MDMESFLMVARWNGCVGEWVMSEEVRGLRSVNR